jgi:hypothetical protein
MMFSALSSSSEATMRFSRSLCGAALAFGLGAAFFFADAFLDLETGFLAGDFFAGALAAFLAAGFLVGAFLAFRAHTP